jgi:hypothetical protein
MGAFTALNFLQLKLKYEIKQKLEKSENNNN